MALISSYRLRNIPVLFPLFLSMALMVFGAVFTQATAGSEEYNALFTLSGGEEISVFPNYHSEKSTSSVIDVSDINTITGAAVSGSVTLRGNESYVRILLTDHNGNEYLIYEMTPLMTTTDTVTFHKVCEETAVMSPADPVSVRVEMTDAVVEINEIVFSDNTLAKSTGDPAVLKSMQSKAKLTKINDVLKSKGKKWVAGETPVSRMTYAEKKQLMGGELPNLYGFEYYTGGIFEIPSTKTAESMPQADDDSPYVSEYSWTDRHGTNWVTPSKNQGSCGSCWAFAATGATELLVNLYYNQLLNPDLSEQDVLSCSGAGSCSGGLPGRALDYITSTGIVTESCFSYTTSNSSCSLKCSSPEDHIIIGGKTSFNYSSEDALKALVIQGPVSFGLSSWRHAIGLVGYKTIAENDRIYIQRENEEAWVTIPAGDPLVGKTAWLIKNSWGTWWGDNGFAYVVTDLDNIGWTHGVNGPVQSIVYTDDDIRCVDNDNDGYYTWGIGPKPDFCDTCPPEPDGDDSDPNLGPMDDYGHISRITDYVSITSPFDNDIIIDNESDIEIRALARAAEGSITRVEFYCDSTLIGESTASPYTLVWDAQTQGSFNLTAIAYNSNGRSVTSLPVNIIISGELGTGAISRYVWTGISGGSINNLTDITAFPESPDLTDELSVFEIPEDWNDNYGTRLAGYLHPPLTGNYTFLISGDDNCELWISSDDSETNTSLISHVPGWTSSREWNKYPEQTSAPIHLEAGRRYYVEALHKEGSGGDNMAVGWQIPGRDTSVIQGQFLSPEFIRYSVRFVAEEHGSITGVTDQSVIEGNPTTPVIPEPDDGYYFTGWTGDHTGTESPLVIDTIQSDMTVTAGFAQKTWTVRFISGENGRISGISEQHIPHGGSTSQVRAVASEGCNFTGWSGDYFGTSERLSIDNVISDMTIRAEFTTNTYTVRFLAGNNGTINGETTQVIRHGSRTLPVTPVADNGYHFTSWSGNYTGQEFSLTIDPVTSDMTITAEFDINSYTVQFVAGDHGSISGQLRQTIIHGGRCTPVKAIPLPDCAFRGWTGGIKSNDIELQVDNVTSDMMIHSQFSIESEETGCFISTLKP